MTANPTVADAARSTGSRALPQAPAVPVESRRVQFVLKVSKFCNLRCRYCYEFDDLGNRERMPLDGLERLYENVAHWYRGLSSPATVEFVWHGGEPLLLPAQYYHETFEAQRRAFGNDTTPRNVIQTNLTVLDATRLELLARFDDVGVSVDLYGELRTDIHGRDSVRRVLRNMDRLRATGIDFGCITVLTNANVGAIRKIIRFYDRLGVNSVRLLPLFDGAFDGQHDGFDITQQEVRAAYEVAFEELVALDSSVRVEPIVHYIQAVVHHHTKGSLPVFYDKRSWEPVYIVDTNGDLYSYADAYDPAFCHGNLFGSPLSRIIRSPRHLLAIAAAEERLESVCRKCRWFGSCDGYPVAEESARQRRHADTATCVIDRQMLDYVERRLRDLGMIGPVTSELVARPPGMPFHRAAVWPLERDVRIRFEGDCGSDCEHRIMLSAGTTDQVAPPTDGLQYLPAAIVPRMPFRAPTGEEADLLVELTPTPAWQLGSDVGVIRIPDEIIRPLERVLDDHGTRDCLDDYRVHTDHPEWDRAYGCLSEYLKAKYSLFDEEPRIVRLASALPSMTTVTKDAVRGEDRHQYVGMHVDSWINAPLGQRGVVQNRICINLGREERYFLFMNLTLARMHAALHGAKVRGTDYYGSDLGHEFMRAFPDYPIVRLTIKPREAYIAPTENIIHDATSVGKSYPDLAMHILGYFGVPVAADRAV